MALTRKKKPQLADAQPEQVFVAVTSGVLDLVALDLDAGHPLHGLTAYVLNEGIRLRGDDIIVRAYPQLFVADGASQLEIAQARYSASGGHS